MPVRLVITLIIITETRVLKIQLKISFIQNIYEIMKKETQLEKFSHFGKFVLYLYSYCAFMYINLYI